ncbi:accessory Sec system translocase SecA2 [Nocardia terpenica]|uniref:accessory Sec system translocase SecA2 n=1 Tax=Nocardia terpenica TaxID=455432 RepID=UPI0015C550D5|nr:accessory Sec system translocase SecA2 [Nocardia terpenica]NQE90916.1 accessory Sec system translocase SecA2 [Nocardia terpenica]
MGDAGAAVRRLLDRPGSANLSRFRHVVAAAGEREDALRGLSAEELTAVAEGLRTAPERPFGHREMAEMCAVGREVARRVLGERAFDVQLLGTVALLHGYVVEMATGEGKTLSGALAAAGYALQGRRVHVVSVNDYLARRDAEWMRELYAALGVSVGWVDEDAEREERRAAYGCDVTYVSVSEVGFDVLRDRLCTDPADTVLPAQDVVIVDEGDSVLVDEATVPLVLAGTVDHGRLGAAATVAEVVGGLAEGEHYEVDDDRRNVYLTDAGIDQVQHRLGGIDLYTAGHVESVTQVQLALHAKALLHRDVDYLVRDGRVELINVARGRVAQLQRWPDGLQAAIEAKEGLAASPTGEVLDSIIVQALIGRYRSVCGMTGTAVAVAENLAEFYKLETGGIPTNLPCIRDDEPDRLYATAAQKLAALVDYVREVHDTGRPVLIGTLSVAESEHVAVELAAAGIDGVVLNAKNDAEEAAIVARAGEYGRVTISTQMAGRGTDIRLGSVDGHDRERVAALGGLCVVGYGRYHTSRLDDQLRGRAGRQGDPGSSVFFTSLDDDLLTYYVPGARPPESVDPDGRVHDGRAQRAMDHAQRVAEGTHLKIHRNTWRYHQLINIQRDEVLTHRDEVLRGDLAARRLHELRPERYDEILAAAGESALRDAARLIVLAHLDERWSEHLAFLADVREGIHLRALGRETPIDEFHRIAVTEFSRFYTEVYQCSADTLDRATITADGLDLESAGLKRPTSTWTYLVTDNPFGSPEERFLDYFGGVIRNGAAKMGLRD